MRASLFFVLTIVVSIVFMDCASSSKLTSYITYSLPVMNETKSLIQTIEIRSEKDKENTLSSIVNLTAGSKTNITFPLIEGWNYIIAYQDNNVSEKPFFVKDGNIVEFVGNKQILDKVSFSKKDFEGKEELSVPQTHL